MMGEGLRPPGLTCPSLDIVGEGHKTDKGRNGCKIA